MPEALATPVVVGLGASAGGIPALTTVLGGLPGDLEASVLVVLHMNPAAPSVLDGILRRVSGLPVDFARERDVLRPAHVYLAPPDHHLRVREGRLALDRAPTVNAVRPSVDVLFSSLAAELGARCIGVVLSGTLYDGAAGLVEIRRAGGRAIVQDPAEAAFPGMPESARILADPTVASAEEIPALITKLVRAMSPVPAEGGSMDPDDPVAAGAESAAGDDQEGQPSEFSCPECGGVLWERAGEVLSFRCRIGHAYSHESLVQRHQQSVEEALWGAVVALEERADLYRRLSARLESSGRRGSKTRYEQGIRSATRNADVLRDLVQSLADPVSAPGAVGPGEEGGA